MTAFVQSYDEDLEAYVKIHVASGEIVGQSKKPFADLDEIEPMDTGKPAPVTVSDPLGEFR
ncbi:MAG: hypothetical protein JNK47_12790 [Mesorhizobium sp.]|nr:hypothetical protein [Mesorhizobium sp.]MBL8578097.1 hypothetical protein [Mesorhizobium sp.]